MWGSPVLFFLGSCFGPVFGHFLEHFWTNFGDPFWDQMGLSRPRWALRGPLRASKSQKPAFAKTLKNIVFFMVFGLPRPSKTALGGPRRLPRGA